MSTSISRTYLHGLLRWRVSARQKGRHITNNRHTREICRSEVPLGRWTQKTEHLQSRHRPEPLRRFPDEIKHSEVTEPTKRSKTIEELEKKIGGTRIKDIANNRGVHGYDDYWPGTSFVKRKFQEISGQGSDNQRGKKITSSSSSEQGAGLDHASLAELANSIHEIVLNERAWTPRKKDDIQEEGMRCREGEIHYSTKIDEHSSNIDSTGNDV